FSKAIGYVTEPGNSRTYVDRLEVGDPNGDQGASKYHVLLRHKDGVSGRDFRRYLTETFAPVVAASKNVAKFRLHLFEPPDTSPKDAPGVSHSDPPERLYHAAYEIAFRSGLERETFFLGLERKDKPDSDYATATKDLARYVRQVAAFPER